MIRLINRLKDEAGGTLIIVAVTLPVMLLILALVADIGMTHIIRAQLQTAADAGSLAGCMYFEEELHSEDYFLWEEGIPVAVRVYVQLEPEQSRERAAQTVAKNLLNLAGVVTVTETNCYLPRETTGEDGRVNYWVVIDDYDEATGSYTYTGDADYDYMDSDDANAYVVELEARITTLLLGPMLSVFYGDDSYRQLQMRVFSMSRFDHLEIIDGESGG